MEKIKYVVLFAVLLIFFGHAKISNAANFFITTSNSTVTAGNTITATVYINSGGTSINSAEGTFTVPSDLFEIQSINTAGSIFSLWVEQPTFSGGVITFSGGIPNPGFSGNSGRVFSFVMKAKQAGSGSLTYQSASIRANDGLGTGVETNHAGDVGALVTISSPVPVTPQANVPGAPIISSNETPDPEKWYSVKQSTFNWSLPKSVTAVELLLNKSPVTEPIIVYSPPISSKTIDDLLEDGVLYLHIRFKSDAGWGPVANRKIKIDTTPPDSLTVSPSISEKDGVTLQLASTDATSYIAKYTFTVDSDTPIEYDNVQSDGTAKYVFSGVSAGLHQVTVKAYDAAGNFKEQTLQINFPTINSPIITAYPKTIAKGERFTIEGTTSYPSSKILVWIKEGDLEEKSFESKTTETGTFKFESDFINTKGLVSVWVEVIKSGGTHSLPSEKIFIAVRDPFYITAVSKVTDLMAVLVPGIAVAVLILLILYFGYYRIKRIKRKIRNDLGRTEDEVHLIMKKLEEDMRKNADILERAGKNRNLTKEEAKIMKNFSANIKMTEKLIKTEFQKIEKEDL